MNDKTDPFEKMELGMNFQYSPKAPLPEDLVRHRDDFLKMTYENDMVKQVYAVAGLALYAAQCFEVEVQLAILTVKRARRHVANLDEYDALQDELTARTLGQLLREVRKVVKVNSAGEAMLKLALEKRNSLVHGFFEIHSMDIITRKGELRMLDSLLERIRLFRMADNLVGGITKSMMEHFGYSPEQIRKLQADAMEAARRADGEGPGDAAE